MLPPPATPTVVRTARPQGKDAAIEKFAPLFDKAPFNDQDQDHFLSYEDLFKQKMDRVTAAFKVVRQNPPFMVAHMKQLETLLCDNLPSDNVTVRVLNPDPYKVFEGKNLRKMPKEKYLTQRGGNATLMCSSQLAHHPCSLTTLL